MSRPPKTPAEPDRAAPKGEAEKRRAREAEALRQNLLKRKAQKRARESADDGPGD